jgi:hypothetical protein
MGDGALCGPDDGIGTLTAALDDAASGLASAGERSAVTLCGPEDAPNGGIAAVRCGVGGAPAAGVGARYGGALSAMGDCSMRCVCCQSSTSPPEDTTVFCQSSFTGGACSGACRGMLGRGGIAGGAGRRSR